MSLDTVKRIYHLQDAEALKRLTTHLTRTTNWSVISPSLLQFPSTVSVTDDYQIQLSELTELIKIDGVWRSANAKLSSLRAPSNPVNVEVVEA